MDQKSKQKLENLLKSIPYDRLFTIEGFVREYLNIQGLPWQGIWEIQAQVDIEKYLIKEGLIRESEKKTILYNITDKVKEL